MDNTSKITAAAALSRIAEIHQFGLQESYAHLAAMESVQQINADAKAATGVDLLNSKKELSFDEIDKYEKFLDELVDNSFPNILEDSFLYEQISLLDDIVDYPSETIANFNYTENTPSIAIKRVFKAIGVSVPSIAPILKNPIKVQQIKSVRSEFLSLSKFTLRSKNIYVLFHMSLGPLSNTSRIGGSISELVSTQQNRGYHNLDKNDLSAVTCFLFKEETAYNQSPVNLFFKAIVKYGQTTTIGSSSKKYYRRGYSSKLIIGNQDNIKIFQQMLGVKGRISGHISVTPKDTGYEYENLYFLYAERMERDYATQQFQ